MASTRLQRKARRNKARAKKKVATIQRLNQKPVIKNVDIEEIKKEFAQKKAGKKTAEAPMADKAEAKVAKEAAKAEKTEAAKVEPKKAEKSEPKKADKAESTKAETKKTEKSESPKAGKKAETKKAEKAASAKEEEEEGVDVDALIKSVGKVDGRSKDDLKNINGIGPAFEKKLNEIGIYSYEQISKLTKKDIENLGKLEGLSAEKIESDDWKGSAKEQIKLAKENK